MKIRNFLAAILVIAFSMSMLNCGEKSDKDKAVDLAKSAYEFFSSEDGKQLMTSGDYEKLMKKMDELAKDAGFESMEDAETVLEKYEDDPDVKEWGDKLDALWEEQMQ